jgi:signal peptidase I
MEQKNENFVKEIFKFSIIVLIIVIPVRVYVAQPFIVSGPSMEPTFSGGEYLIVDQLSHRFTGPERGSVIIFKFPENPSKFYIKRVIGLPGETVELRGSTVIIKNSENPSGVILDEPYLATDNKKTGFLTTSLEDDEYFVLGDNRNGSSDSRGWGPLNEDFIVGRAFIQLFPFKEISFLPGEHTGTF